ncbi:MAG TPA: aminopeptidase [Gaiellaceae bacterium]|jgi:aminopeptidase
MNDPRVARLADLVVNYSLELSEGDVVRIDALDVATPLALSVYRSALEVGAHPYGGIGLDGLLEILLDHGSDEQLAYISSTQWKEIETIDALVTIWSEANTRSLTRVDAERHSRYIAAHRQLANRRWDRISGGSMAWCGTLHPTAAHAQDAGMSLQDYESFVFGACHADGENPAEHWREVAGALEARASSLASVKELRIVGPDTDLSVGVAGRTWIAADGKYNMPDGEVFTSPVETETAGQIRFTFPAIFQGREVEDVRLRFEGGSVVEASAARGEDYLRSLIGMDEGARILGEMAFGLNYEIDRFTRNILFDEKIGGTIHVALGAGFPQAGGKNSSGLHWDLICDLRAEGEVYADGELVWKAGEFVAEPVLEAV